ncbi:MAG: hypothetical protein ACRD4U_08025, partial [Candidatus Acidiferrales bacterium]
MGSSPRRAFAWRHDARQYNVSPLPRAQRRRGRFRGDSMEIHPTAIVHPKARLPEQGRIGPYCV